MGKRYESGPGGPKEINEEPPFRRNQYPDPLESARSLDAMEGTNIFGKTIGELREGRQYDVRVVDEYVERVTNPSFMPPGASMLLFVACLTNTQFPFSQLNHTNRLKLRQLYTFFRDAEEWTQTNILYKWREWFYHEASLKFIKGFAGAARRKDQVKAEM